MLVARKWHLSTGTALSVSMLLAVNSTGCSEVASPIDRNEYASYYICHGLAEIRDRSNLEDVELTSKYLGITLRERQMNSTTYTVEAAPPEILGDSFTYVASNSPHRIELKFRVDESHYCVTPNALQSALGNLRTSTTPVPATGDTGVVLEPFYRVNNTGGFRMLMQVGSGCLSDVDLIQDDRLAGPKAFVPPHGPFRRE